MIEGFEQGAEVGFVQVPGQLEHPLGVMVGNSLRDFLDEGAADIALVVAQAVVVLRPVRGSDVGHGGLALEDWCYLRLEPG